MIAARRQTKLADALGARSDLPGLELSLAGRSPPAVRYALGCVLATQQGDGWTRRSALREVRALVELGNPWVNDDPYMRPLMTDPEFKHDFFRLVEGPRPSIEYAVLTAKPKQVTQGET